MNDNEFNRINQPKSVVGPARSFPNFSSRVFSWSCSSNFFCRIGDGGSGACRMSFCCGECGGGGESLPLVAFAETGQVSMMNILHDIYQLGWY